MKGNQAKNPVLRVSTDDSSTAANLEQQIRLRAYQLYEERGRQDGFDQQDWIQAEAEVLDATGVMKAAV